ncbi:RHS repeat-associated core domain-containing protein [Yeguia hominis]|uniref:RHS repeat-associated core domain-containing protein n=1 Tax=Yeguia hominis TaxID=2763662 RepID=A0A926D722_9FIRM|nr:RHS repeat-associated core domain-containing protein [Yeguia hominis]MBC8533605.1 RHS repeat-associated core domain-containing protein [Yeguia hominis]
MATDYFLNGTKILAQKTGSTVTWFYYDQQGTRVAMEHGGKLYYYLYNLQGDVIALCDASSKQIVAKYSYDAWGKLLTKENLGTGTIADVNPFRYRGYYYDSETEMYYLNSRYYDPEVGRFLNADGLLGANESSSGYNLFSYCGNNPANRSDSNGKFAAAIGAAAMFGLGIIAAAAVSGLASVGIISRSTATKAQRTIKKAITNSINQTRIKAAFWSSAITMAASAAVVYPAMRNLQRQAERDKEKSATKAPPLNPDTPIYRYGGTNPGSLTPSQHDVDMYPLTGRGLSFSTVPPLPGQKAAVTTIENLNKTGVVYAVKDGVNHVSVHPIGGTLEEWHNAGSSSVWTTAVKSVVVKWDGGN